MINWEIAAKIAALPYISAEILPVVFLPTYSAISIVIAEPIILYGPPTSIPIASIPT